MTSIVNSSADTTLEVNYNGSLLAPGSYGPTSPNDSIPATGGGTRMMWYPAKAAFRAGQVEVGLPNSEAWDASNVGDLSVAFGKNTEASGARSTAMGYITTASGTGATALGTETVASGLFSTALGAATVADGISSLTAGENAKVASDNTFVWADGSDTSADKFSSADDPNGSGITGSKTFHIKSTNGIRVITGGGTTYIPGSSTGWSTTSSRTAKTNVGPVDPSAVLAAVEAMEINTWEYKDENGNGQGTRHIGPMAEDFHGELSYDLGGSDDHINSINADGVALGAVKGLAQKVQNQKDQIADLKAENEQIRSENEEIKERLAALEAERSPSALAGLTGSSAGLLLAFLLGGLLGAGLLHARRR
ncbi:hypothetical protein BSZ35_18265 [Salinibacter sp. 10B]|nr:hypothetical protein BSZ35_18265 [Salinibacter sp. 10B]